jgi:hypothetical protein
VDFSNADDVRSWLKDKSPEAAWVLAVRAFLRVVPAVVIFDVGAMSHLVLQAFRSGVMAKYPTQRGILFDNLVRAVDVARTAGFTAAFADSSGLIAAAVNLAVSHAFDDPDVAPDADRAPNARVALASAAFADDARSLEYYSPSDIADHPLWPTGSPKWATQAWDRLAHKILRIDQNWDIWADWYDARLTGRPGDEDFEFVCETVFDDIWQQGSKVANAEIKRLMKERKLASRPSWMTNLVRPKIATTKRVERKDGRAPPSQRDATTRYRFHNHSRTFRRHSPFKYSTAEQ